MPQKETGRYCKYFPICNLWEAVCPGAGCFHEDDPDYKEKCGIYKKCEEGDDE